MKSIKNILFFVCMLAYLIVVTGFISSREKTKRITQMDIRVVDSSDNQFIHTADIRRMLNLNTAEVIGKEINQVDLETLENRLKKKQIIRKAEAFITEPGILHVEVSQKTPFVRVFNRYGEGYYLDKAGNIIPLSTGFSSYVLVANGFIAEPFTVSKTINIMDVKHDSINRSLHTIYDVYKLATYINADDFWSAQIEQIYVNNNYDIELIPRVGSHIIEIGRVENLDEKFDNLKTLYLRGFNKLGWNKYDKISLKYKNQVVCTKIQ